MFWKSIENNDAAQLAIILKEENISRTIKDDYGYSPIHIAITKESTEVGQLLIENEFDCNIQDSKNGQTPLHYCALYNNLEIANLLLKKNAKLDISDKYGNEPLWTAVFNDKGFGRRVEMVQLFLQYNADKNHKNNVGLSPMEAASSAGYKAISELFEAENL